MKLPAIFAAGVVLLLSLATPSSGSFLNRIFGGLTPQQDQVFEYIPSGLSAAISSTRVNWKETSTLHEIMIDVPGLERGELKIETVEENRALRVSGERRSERRQKGDYWHRLDRPHGWFGLEFRLPDNADMDLVGAKLARGVLTVTFAKLPPEQIKGAKVVILADIEEDDDKRGKTGRESKSVEI